MSVLSEKGWSLDKLLERVATGEDPKPTVEDKVSELQKKLDQLEAAKKEAEEYARAQTEQKVIAEYKNQIKTVIDSDASRFEAIRMLGEYDMVFDTAEVVYQKNGRIPEIGEVAEAVESYLTRKLEKAFELQKFKARFQQTPNTETSPKAQETRIPGAQTLTATTTAVSKPPQGGKLLSKEDSLKEAAKLIRWT
jgi:vacuolar-type H+-ATPase subunit I/STV1